MLAFYLIFIAFVAMGAQEWAGVSMQNAAVVSVVVTFMAGCAGYFFYIYKVRSLSGLSEWQSAWPTRLRRTNYK